MQEVDMAALKTGKLRWKEAEYFLEQYIKHCGPPIDSYFHMVCYLDAFLFSLVSVEEVVDDSVCGNMRKKDSFLFLKALRNTNAHHIILGIGLEDSKFSSPIARVLSISVGRNPNNSSKLKFRFDELRQIFSSIETERPGRDKATLDGARRFMTAMEAQNRGADFIESFMHDGLNDIKALL